MDGDTERRIDASEIRNLANEVKNLVKLMTGNGDPTSGYIVQFDRVKQFLIDELGYEGDKSKRLSARVSRLEAVVFPIIALATPISIWATIEVLRFLMETIFHAPGGAVYIVPTPTPHP